VRVAGGGQTNYAVAKDDLGNWYVKGYSAKPDDVINSMKSFALFNVGAKIGANLVPQAPRTNLAGALAVPGGVKSDSERTALEHAFDRFRTKYVEDTQKHYEKARKLIEEADGSAMLCRSRRHP
jgi:hypothetical protein